jgi:SPOR domain
VRNAFLALLLVNLAYFAWTHWVDVPPPPPVNETIAKLPRLKLAEEVPPAERSQPGAAKKTALNEPAACLSVGPFADPDASARAATLLRAKGFDLKQRAEEGQSSEGYWVYVGGLASEADADKALVTLEHGGIKDGMLMPDTPDAGRRVSLGMYSERARAEKRAQAVRDQTGLEAEIVERKLAGTVYWLDLAPPPGTGTVPLEDLFAQGVGSRIGVRPCPAPAPAAPPTGTATARPAAPHGAATASAQTAAVTGSQLR